MEKKELGARLREIRIRTGIRQEDFAAGIGVSRSAIVFYEKGERTPDAVTLIRIADYLGVSLDYVVGRSDRSDNTCADFLSPPALEAMRNDQDAALVADVLLSSKYAPELLSVMAYMRNNSINAIEAGEADDEDSLYQEIQERLESRALKLIRRIFCAKSLEDQPIIRDGVSGYSSIRRAYEQALGFAPGSIAIAKGKEE